MTSGQMSEQRAVDCLRVLVMDAVEEAGNGHPGTAMALAPLAFLLWSELLKFDPQDPKWLDRDRFVLSCGHASMLLYGALHLAGYDLCLDDIKRLRKWGSRTPGHPERGLTPGVEVTTGPLGQGVANAVGMAMAESFLARRFVDGAGTLFDHRTWVLASDGDLMEGLASEAASLAGHLRLHKLIVLYDDNGITIDGPSSLAFTEDVRQRFESYRWRTTEVEDVNDLYALRSALWWAKAEDVDRPTLVVVHSHIAQGSPHLQDSHLAHGSPLGTAEVRATKTAYGWDPEARFFVPADVYASWRRSTAAGRAEHDRWRSRVGDLNDEHPSLAAELRAATVGALPEAMHIELGKLSWGDRPCSTREASGRVLASVAGHIPWLVGGSADLTETTFAGMTDLASGPGSVARYTHFGVREHAMAGICNGIAAHRPLRPYCSTFLVFSDYMRPSMRLAALMGLPVVYILSHDSIGLAGDGPTHQPIEQLASLRAIPNLHVVRPADGAEVAMAWQLAMERTSGPTALVLCRQDLPQIDRGPLADAGAMARGAYVVADTSDDPDVVLLASGSEVWVCLAARELLGGESITARVVSMPCWERFEEQSQDYRRSVLPPGSTRVAVEAAAPLGWAQWVGEAGAVVGMNRFGACGQGTEVLERFGFNPANVAEVAREALARRALPPAGRN